MATVNDLLIRIVARNLTTRVIRGLQTDVESLGKTTSIWSKKIANIGGFLSYAFIGASIGMAAAVGGAIKAAIDFESAFAGVRKTVEASEAEFAVMAQSIRDMAKEIPVSVEEIAKVAEISGQLGVAKEDIIGFTRVMVDLGATTDLSSEEAATAIAKFTTIMQTPLKNVDKLGSIIVDLGNKSAATETEIVNMATRMAGAGKQAGLTEAEILAFASTLASVGVSAEMGGTAIQKFIADLERMVIYGGKDLEKLAEIAGTTSEDFAKAYKEEPMVAITAFINGLAKIRKEGGSLVTTFDELGFNEQRLRTTLFKLAGAEGLLDKQLKIAIQAQIENNALTEEARKRYETAASQLKIFWNRVNDLGITIGNILIPKLTIAIGILGDFAIEAEKVVKNSKDMKKNVGFGEKFLDALSFIVFSLIAITNGIRMLKVAFDFVKGGLAAWGFLITSIMLKIQQVFIDVLDMISSALFKHGSKLEKLGINYKSLLAVTTGMSKEITHTMAKTATLNEYFDKTTADSAKNITTNLDFITNSYDSWAEAIGKVRQKWNGFLADMGKGAKLKGGVLPGGEGGEVYGPPEPEPFPDMRAEDYEQLFEVMKQSGQWQLGLIAGFGEIKQAGFNWAEATYDFVGDFQNTMTSGFSTTIQGMLEGTMTLKEGLNGLWKNITSAFIQAVSQMMAKWLAFLAIMAVGNLIVPGFGGTAAGMAFKKLAGFQTGTGMAGVPITGPALLHQGEIVLNKKQSDALRSGEGLSIGKEGEIRTKTQTNVNLSFNINAVDSSDFEDIVRDKIIPMLRQNYRDHGDMRNMILES